LKPGANELRLRLRNRWGSTRTTEPVVVTWLRPPRVLAVKCPPPADRPFLDLSARVDSQSPPTRARAELETRGADGVPRARTAELALVREGDVWTASARGVPVDPGETSVRVWAWNADGRSPDPGRAPPVLVRKPAPPPPEVEFLEPALDTTAQRPE